MSKSGLAVYKLEPILDVPKYQGFASKEEQGSFLGNDFLHQDFVNPPYDGVNLRPNILSAVWKPIEVIGCVRKFNDYPCIDMGIPAFSQRAVDALRDFLELNGELLPLISSLGQYWAYNVTTVADILEEGCSEAGLLSKTLSEDRLYRHIVPSKLEGLVIFRMRQDCSGVYVTEPFVQRVREKGLRGLCVYKICPLPPGVTWRNMRDQAWWEFEHEDLTKDKTPKGNTLVMMLRLAGGEPTKVEQKRIDKLMDQLDAILVDADSDAPAAGSLEGNDRVPGECRLFLSCPDADELAKKLWPWLKSLDWKGEVKVVKRFGEQFDASAREEYVDLKSDEPGKSVAVRETPISAETREKIESNAERGRELLGLPHRATMAKVQETIERWIEDYRQQKLTPLMPEEAAEIVGSFWGQSLCNDFNWQWAMVNRCDQELCGVVSLMRDCVVFPIDQFFTLLTNPEMRVNTAEVHKLIRSKKLPPTKPKGYLILGTPLPSLQPIVPP